MNCIYGRLSRISHQEVLESVERHCKSLIAKAKIRACTRLKQQQTVESKCSTFKAWVAGKRRRIFPAATSPVRAGCCCCGNWSKLTLLHQHSDLARFNGASLRLARRVFFSNLLKLNRAGTVCERWMGREGDMQGVSVENRHNGLIPNARAGAGTGEATWALAEEI